MTTPPILGLDIGGANLKAATSDKRAAAVPFPLWKQPDKLSAALADLVQPFSDCDEIAVTMTGELCDCFQTKREGVHAIIKSVRNVSRSRAIHVWSTDGQFLNSEEANEQHLKVASANWHALATFAGAYVPQGPAVLIDVGSTTTDVIPLESGLPVARGRTDPERFENNELVYTGVTRTPLCSLMGAAGAAELFATTRDVYLLLDRIPEDEASTDTADGRPATKANAHARIARMHCSDHELMPEADAVYLAERLAADQKRMISFALGGRVSQLSEGRRTQKNPTPLRLIVCGSGEWLALEVAVEHARDHNPLWTGLSLDAPDAVLLLGDRLGPELSACAPAYAVAVLAMERRG